MSNVVKQSDENKRSSEWKAFFFITVVLFPILSVGVVGAYGFSVWFMQMLFFGMPGHGG
ncbi:trimethylamine N-oxide reductase system protein TorE [Aliivibrio fischeri]|uniref:TorE protein n=2 Tax=Aliivibrio fischeri TaxID=668 RepID=Q5E0S9_ALIF1|nr:trimethylamine N-oxide reductase system protein TorE [Aliivibrio fischeri]AAW87367.1 TorE protein [Aliivibrio fischeri ES114]EHN69005.1 TorE protein [Aliivibrio fischeri SR5]KLU77995.1 TorE protein [Aliivibrio fischeri]MBP3139348.1 trimethylamine N-oxide reductase system protein TorE [Aliivibrio fischeri]MBP3154940.1 trimethylamine N-oxide reductase system protein TorE [Aliivibrio fischeri]